MAKYIHAITGEKAPADLVERAKSMRVRHLANSVDLTEREIIYKRYLTRYYISWNEIIWAFRQVATSHVKIGRAKGMLSEHRVLLYTAPDKHCTIVFDHEEPAKELLKMVQKMQPECAIGFTPENKERFGVTESPEA